MRICLVSLRQCPPSPRFKQFGARRGGRRQKISTQFPEFDRIEPASRLFHRSFRRDQWNRDLLAAARTGRTGPIGNDSATQSSACRHHDASGLVQEVALADGGSNFLSAPSPL